MHLFTEHALFQIPWDNLRSSDKRDGLEGVGMERSSKVKIEGIQGCPYFMVLRGVNLYTEMSSFQGVKLKG